MRVVNGVTLSIHPNRSRGEVEDLTGKQFGELTVENFDHKDSHGRAIWKCLCSCGKEKLIPARSLKSGLVISCGHVNREKAAERLRKLSYKHGASNEPWFTNYVQMISRTLNPDSEHQKYYNHDRIQGLLLEPEWKDDPWAFYKEIGPKPNSEATVDRINPRRGYVKGNVRWASRELQSINRIISDDKLGEVKLQGIQLAHKGVNRRARDRYFASIQVDKKQIPLGYFLDLDNAKRARYDAETKYGFPHTFRRPEGDFTPEPDYTHGEHPGIVYDKARKKYRVYLTSAGDAYVGQYDSLEDAKQRQIQIEIDYKNNPRQVVEMLNSRRHHNGIVGIDPEGNRHYYESGADARRKLNTHANLFRRLSDGKPFTSPKSKLCGWRFEYVNNNKK